MRDPKRPPPTYADIERLPEHLVGQILEGELFVMPRPGPAHALVGSNMGGEINQRFGRGGPPTSWWVLDEPELHLGRDVVVPDFAGWRRERLPSMPKTAYFEVAPDWVCEILSPSTSGIDRVKKARIYAANQVPFMWLVEPVERVIETYQLSSGQWLRTGAWAAGERLTAPPFDSVEFDTGAWFPPLEPSP